MTYVPFCRPLGGPAATKETAMGFMDRLKGMMRGHEHRGRKVVDKPDDTIDDRTGHRYGSQIDDATERAEDRLGLGDEGRGPRDDRR
jgi:MT0933-like antitoxin protein